MLYPNYTEKQHAKLDKILNYKLKGKSKDIDDGSGLCVGDSVEINTKKHEKVLGEIIKKHFCTYYINPYNTPYYNNPIHKSKLGPFCSKELKKIKKPKNASLEFVEQIIVETIDDQGEATLDAFETAKTLSKRQKVQLKAIIKDRGDGNIKRDELISLGIKLYKKRTCLLWIAKWGEENRTGRGRYSLKVIAKCL